MHYHRDDVEHLLLPLPCLQVAVPNRALAVLQTAVATGDELSGTLARYPEVRHKPLDFHYLCLQGIGALDDALMADLLTDYGWPGVLWASLLACLAPDALYRPLLEAALGRAPYQDWAVTLALNVLSGEASPANVVLQDTLAALRRQLSALPRPTVRLRRVLPQEDFLPLQALVRKTYRISGAAAALLILRTASLSSYNPPSEK